MFVYRFVCGAWSLFLPPYTLLYCHLDILLCNILLSCRNHICILGVLLVCSVLQIFDTLLLMDFCSWPKHPWRLYISIVVIINHPWTWFDTLERVTVLVVARVVGCKKSNNTPIPLLDSCL